MIVYFLFCKAMKIKVGTYCTKRYNKKDTRLTIPIRIEDAKGNVKSRVAEFLKSETKDSESAMELAEDLDPQTAHDQDLIFKLYYFAAMRDNEKGSLRYAECLDPSKPAWGSIEKDPVEAWEYYGKSSDGISMRQNMKDWVEREANNGNSQAKKWLKKLK